ncbi:MAG: hypothetical protein R3F49_17110 [Planctomycetota bacterium]
MSPIGRIFVVVNLALAAVFLGWASSTLANAHKYRGLYDQTTAELQTTKSNLQQEIETLKAARDEARRQKDETVQQNAALETTRKSLDQQIASLTDDKNKMTERVGSIDATLKGYLDEAEKTAQKLKEATDQRVAAVEAKRDAENAAQAALQAQRNAEAAQRATEAKNNDLMVQLAAATEDLGRKDTIIETFVAETGLSIGELGGEVPTIPAAVVGVMEQGGQTLVHINKGKNDGVKTGYKFWIYSGATLKGLARVEVVNAATSTVVMVDATPGQTVSQGDRATTRL